jgi:Mlc titration factor MtfA (ptsG expression regulator)
LSWQDCLEGAAHADDGRNVVIHEFAHQLDQESGPANGAPLHVSDAPDYSPQRWSQVFHASYAQLQHQARTGHVGLLDPYGAQDPAEFFAVASEVFFEQSAELRLEYPELYRELAGFYRVDPSSW